MGATERWLELGDVLGRQGIEGAMNHHVGIWIDHKKAVIVSASADHVTAKTLESDVGSHPRYSGQQDGGGEKQYEERTANTLTATTTRSSVSWGNPRPF